jgi:DNA modification methylase
MIPVVTPTTVQRNGAERLQSHSRHFAKAGTDQRNQPADFCNVITFKGVQLGLIQSEALEAVKLLPSDTFNVVITSPPYFWVRDYGFKEQIGHEGSVKEYIDTLADIFDEVKRVLHPEGVFYLNIGDTYYSGNGQPHGHDPACSSRNFMRKKLRPVDQSGWDIPRKSLIGIPWQLAFELQKRKWTLRGDIVWQRDNALSEASVRDRPHRSYEHIFMFSKSRFYAYNRAALGDQEDIWSFPIERAKIIDHNAPFPTDLVRRCILTGSPPGGRVLDPFVGSGTTLKVAAELGRHAVGIDAHPSYLSQVSKALQLNGCAQSSWSKLSQVLKTKDDQMKTWPGAIRNMRKPGSPRQAANGRNGH